MDETTTSPSSTDDSSSSSSAKRSLHPPISNPSLDVTGRVFLITGGTQGLGLSIARLLRELGAAGLVLVSRGEDKGREACTELNDDEQDGGCRCVHVRADLGDADDASRVVPDAVRLMSDVGPITGVVNAAATTARGNLFTETASGFDSHMAVNVRAPFLITQAAARHMIETVGGRRSGRCGGGGGSIVNICSVAAHGGAPFVMAYSASKAALVTLTKTNAAELAPHGIRVNGINMGWCLTDNEDAIQSGHDGAEWAEKADAGVPLGRILRPRDVATTVAFLLSDASVMMTGSIVDLHPEFAHGIISHNGDERDGR